MNMGNITTQPLIKGPLAESGMGDIWGDLMTTTANAYSQRQAASIAQSQAAQAQAQAAAAAANAATLAAASKPKMNTIMMVGLAVVGVGLVWFLKRRKRK